MRRILMIFMTLATVTASFAKPKNNGERVNVDFYGVDFSAVNVVGADETSEKFIDAFERINGLLISEQSKYDVGKYLGLDVLSTDYEPAVKEIAKLKDTKFKDKKLTDIDIKSTISNYPSTNNKGLLIIAKELNKLRNTGVFIAVIYDGNTKEILSEQEFLGKAGGFGLRNFWAGALYNGLKNTKFKSDIYR